MFSVTLSREKTAKYCSIACRLTYVEGNIRKAKLGHKVTKSTRLKLRLANIGKKLSEETKKKMSKSKIGHKGASFKHTKEAREKISRAGKGRKDSQQTRNKKSKSRKKIMNYIRGKTYEQIYGKEKAFKIKLKLKEYKHTDQALKKIRLARIESIKQNYGECWPNYNKKACEFFRVFDEKNKIKGRYAIYGGGEYYIKKLGYWVDYINFDKKLIIEWDEPYHNKQKIKDKKRQKEIQDFFPKFEFIRIK